LYCWKKVYIGQPTSLQLQSTISPKTFGASIPPVYNIDHSFTIMLYGISTYTESQYAQSSSSPWLHVVNLWIPEVLVCAVFLPLAAWRFHVLWVRLDLKCSGGYSPWSRQVQCGNASSNVRGMSGMYRWRWGGVTCSYS